MSNERDDRSPRYRARALPAIFPIAFAFFAGILFSIFMTKSVFPRVVSNREFSDLGEHTEPRHENDLANRVAALENELRRMPSGNVPEETNAEFSGWHGQGSTMIEWARNTQEERQSPNSLASKPKQIASQDNATVRKPKLPNFHDRPRDIQVDVKPRQEVSRTLVQSNVPSNAARLSPSRVLELPVSTSLASGTGLSGEVNRRYFIRDLVRETTVSGSEWNRVGRIFAIEKLLNRFDVKLSVSDKKELVQLLRDYENSYTVQLGISIRLERLQEMELVQYASLHEDQNPVFGRVTCLSQRNTSLVWSRPTRSCSTRIDVPSRNVFYEQR